MTVYKTMTTTNRRGNTVKAPDADGPYTRKAAIVPQRSSRAEVPGQQQINVMELIVDYDLADVELWSRVDFDGKVWDVVAPPAPHYGTRQTRHLSIQIRERPPKAESP